MTADLVILGIIVALALWGALSGMAKQLAYLASFVAGYLLTHPLAELLAPRVAKWLQLPRVVAMAATTLVCFILIVAAVRVVTTPVLRRFIAGKNPEDRSNDRILGFLFGALKAGFVAWVALSCLTFVEENVAIAGHRLNLSPKDSRLFAWARQYNVITATHFAAVDELVEVARATKDPAALRKLEQDPRLRTALGDQSVRRALEKGDVQALLRNNQIAELVQDPAFIAKLHAATSGAQ
ncbi:MAG TPA: CvpA family protein [Myxococcaceae bacterium]|nr:CvpA family protein [Myxococcaceae bacterium]